MTADHFYNTKYAGFVDPEGDEEVDIITLRKAKFMRFVERMIRYPARIKNPERDPMPTDKDHTIIKAAESGLIPWFHPNKTPDEYIREWKEKNKEARESDSGFRQSQSRPWGAYFYTCFFGLAPKLIMMDKDALIKKREDLYEEIDVSGLPQDGSRGQARASRNNKRRTIDWFIGQWDGEYTDWEENITVSEQFS